MWHGPGPRERDDAQGGGTAYLGLTGSKGGIFDSGSVYQANYAIDTLSQSGTYEFFSTYLDAGVLSGNGGSGTAILFACTDPGVPAGDGGLDRLFEPW